jgi:alpha-tubulin suppressor-like RCC1 family protein
MTRLFACSKRKARADDESSFCIAAIGVQLLFCEYQLETIVCGDDSVMTAPRPGMLYVWGRNSDGQCGVCPPDATPTKTIALPSPVPSLKNVVCVCCGTGQQGCTIAVLADGSVWSFGKNSGGRLGYAISAKSSSTSIPHRIEGLRQVRVLQVSCSDAHALAVTDDGQLFSW